jgi:integrase
MASIYPNGDRIYISFTDAYGKRVQKSLKLRTTKDGWAKAKDIAARVEAEMVISPISFTGQQEVRPKRITLSAFLDALHDDPEYKQTHSKSTLQLNRLAANKLIVRLGDLPLDAIGQREIWLFRESVLGDDGEVNAAIYIRHLGAIFSCAVLRGYIPASPITKQARIRLQRRAPIAMTRTELGHVLDKAREVYGEPFERQCRFLSLTGFRAGESCELVRSQIDFDRRLISHANIKGRRTDPFPLYPKLEALLEPSRLLSASDRIFHYRSPATLSHYFFEVRKALALNPAYSLHTLKKNFVSALIEAGISPLYLQHLANHTDLRTTTDHYAWWDMSELRSQMESASALLP